MENHADLLAFGVVEGNGHRLEFQTEEARLKFPCGNHWFVAVIIDGEAFRIQLQGGREVDFVHADAALQIVGQLFRYDVDNFLLYGRHEEESHDQKVKGDEGTDDDQGDS